MKFDMIIISFLLLFFGHFFFTCLIFFFFLFFFVVFGRKNMVNSWTEFIAKHLVAVAVGVAFAILFIPPAPDGDGRLDVSRKDGLYGSETTAENLSDDILVWVQISDVHVQGDMDQPKSLSFRRFLSTELPIINPEFVFDFFFFFFLLSQEYSLFSCSLPLAC